MASRVTDEITDTTTIYALNVNGTACDIDYGLVSSAPYTAGVTLTTESTGFTHLSDEFVGMILPQIVQAGTIPKSGSGLENAQYMLNPQAILYSLIFATVKQGLHLSFTLDAENYNADTGAVTATDGQLGFTLSGVTIGDNEMFDSTSLPDVYLPSQALYPMSGYAIDWSQIDPNSGSSSGGGSIVK